MSYPAPPPASQPPSDSSSSGRSGGSAGARLSRAQASGFLNDLFDIRFTRFVSLRLISVVYVVILVAVSLLALALVFAGFANGVAAGLFTLVLAVLGWVIYVVLARVALEAYAVLFRIHDDTSRMAEALGALPPAGNAGQGYDQPPAGGYGSGDYDPSGGYGVGGYGARGAGYGGRAQPGQDPSGPPWV